MAGMGPSKEPVAYASIIRAIVFGISFYFKLTPEQTAAIMGALEAILLVTVRSNVSPVPKENEQNQRSVDGGYRARNIITQPKHQGIQKGAQENGIRPQKCS